MTTTVSQAIHTADTISAGTGTIASGAFWSSGTVGAINNIPSSGTTVSSDLMDIFINLGTASVTLGTAPYLAVTLIDQDPNTGNYVNPGTTAAASPNLLTTQTIPLNAGAVLTGELILPDIRIRPYEFLTLIQNNTGTVWPNSTITAQRKTNQFW
jgi:hypothetical protein